MTTTELLIENKELKEINGQLRLQIDRQIKEHQNQIELLKTELANLKKLIFGAKRERFIGTSSADQKTLFDLEASLQTENEVIEKTIKQKTKRKAPETFKRNKFPKNLTREVTTLEPEGLTDEWKKIGAYETEILGYEPATLKVLKTIRPKYVKKGNEDAGIKQAKMPPRLIAGGIVDESLISAIVVDKILHHTPLHRFKQKLKQAGVTFVSENNLCNWFHKAAKALKPLAAKIKADMLADDYNQADESTIKVLQNNKKTASQKGYMWLMYNPKMQSVLFEYHPGRTNKACAELLKDYKGIVQADGYESYESLSGKQGFRLIHCMAHGRRKFVEAKNNDPPKAEYFLKQVQQLYQIEAQLRIDKSDNKTLQDRKSYHQHRLKVRQQKAMPILLELGKWLESQIKDAKVLPKSNIGKAIAYNLKRWEKLSAYAFDGRLEIDNNLIENQVRPLALGRKNYLFAGSHEAAKNLACLYTIIGTAKQHQLNMHKYINWLLRSIAKEEMTMKNLASYLPYNLSKENLVKFKL